VSHTSFFSVVSVDCSFRRTFHVEDCNTKLSYLLPELIIVLISVTRVRICMEMKSRKLTMEPCRLTLEPRGLTIEPCR
jgi:hypothetical protein